MLPPITPLKQTPEKGHCKTPPQNPPQNTLRKALQKTPLQHAPTSTLSSAYFLRISGEAILGTQRYFQNMFSSLFIRISGEAILGTQRYLKINYRNKRSPQLFKTH